MESRDPTILTDAENKPPSRQNRRAQSGASAALHSSLLLLSTTVASVFCYLYLTKAPPVTQAPSPPKAAPSPARAPNPPLPAPEPIRKLSPTAAKAPTHAGLEETNLRVQHVLTAESSTGRIDRIELNVPILYQSRSLRWTDEEVNQARSLQLRLTEYQEQSRKLREEGRSILDSWNSLIARSIPSTALRADSPSLPSNQRDAMDDPRPSGWTSTDLIEIKPSKP